MSACFTCGLPKSCCHFPRIPLTVADVERLAAPQLLVAPLPGLPEGYVAEMARRADGACVALLADERCSRYPVRPQACRDQVPCNGRVHVG